MLLARRNARLRSVRSAIGRRLRDTVIRIMPASLFVKTYVEFGTPPPLD